MKLLIRVEDITKNSSHAPDVKNFRWVHLCYVDENLYEQFALPYRNSNRLVPINELLSDWCRDDFGVDLEMTTPADLETLRTLIKERYKKLYPEIYKDSNTDKQGWTRVWLTGKIKETIKKHGKQSK